MVFGLSRAMDDDGVEVPSDKKELKIDVRHTV